MMGILHIYDINYIKSNIIQFQVVCMYVYMRIILLSTCMCPYPCQLCNARCWSTVLFSLIFLMYGHSLDLGLLTQINFDKQNSLSHGPSSGITHCYCKLLLLCWGCEFKLLFNSHSYFHCNFFLSKEEINVDFMGKGTRNAELENRISIHF